MFSLKHSHTKDPSQEHQESHSHTHGTIDPAILATERGLRMVKWSLIGLAGTAVFQLILVFFTGSVALFADTIHNIADAATAIR